MVFHPSLTHYVFSKIALAHADYLRPPLPDDWQLPSAYAVVNPGDAWKHKRMAFPNLAEMDYRTVLRFIQKYFPINDMIGQVLTPALLDEFCLLDPELMKACP